MFLRRFFFALLLAAFICIVWSGSVCLGQVKIAPIVVDVDAGHRTGPYEAVWSYFGADEPNYSYAANGRHLMGELSQLSTAPVYLRLHNLLTTGDGSSSLKWGSTNVYREDAQGKPIYDWTITDKIFDAMRDNRITPLVEVGFMPEALSVHPKPYRHTFPDGSGLHGMELSAEGL